MALFGLVSIRVASHSCAVCSPLQFQGPPPQEALHDCPTGTCPSDHITLFYFVGQ